MTTFKLGEGTRERLDRLAEDERRASDKPVHYAGFAHCVTCGKGVSVLAQKGWYECPPGWLAEFVSPDCIEFACSWECVANPRLCRHCTLPLSEDCHSGCRRAGA